MIVNRVGREEVELTPFPETSGGGGRAREGGGGGRTPRRRLGGMPSALPARIGTGNIMTSAWDVNRDGRSGQRRLCAP